MTTPALVQLGEMLKRSGEGEHLQIASGNWWTTFSVDDLIQNDITLLELMGLVKQGRLRLRPGTQSEEE